MTLLGLSDPENLQILKSRKQIMEFLNLVKSVINLFNNSAYFDTKKLYSELKLNPEPSSYATFRGTRCPVHKIYQLFEKMKLKNTVERSIKAVFNLILLYLKNGHSKMLDEMKCNIEEILSCLDVFRINTYFRDNNFGDLMVIFVDGLMNILEDGDKTNIELGKVKTDCLSRKTTGND